MYSSGGIDTSTYYTSKKSASYENLTMFLDLLSGRLSEKRTVQCTKTIRGVRIAPHKYGTKRSLHPAEHSVS